MDYRHGNVLGTGMAGTQITALSDANAFEALQVNPYPLALYTLQPEPVAIARGSRDPGLHHRRAPAVARL